jgi:hypothetical protein
LVVALTNIFNIFKTFPKYQILFLDKIRFLFLKILAFERLIAISKAGQRFIKSLSILYVEDHRVF